MWRADIRSILVTGEWREDHHATHEVWSVIVFNDYGTRYVHDHGFKDDRAGAEKLLARVQKAIEFDGFTPIKREHWTEMEPVYGSEAYEDFLADQQPEPDYDDYYTMAFGPGGRYWHR